VDYSVVRNRLRELSIIPRSNSLHKPPRASRTTSV
jgi:hypothetical protein